MAIIDTGSQNTFITTEDGSNKNVNNEVQSSNDNSTGTIQLMKGPLGSPDAQTKLGGPRTVQLSAGINVTDGFSADIGVSYLKQVRALYVLPYQGKPSRFYIMPDSVIPGFGIGGFRPN